MQKKRKKIQNLPDGKNKYKVSSIKIQSNQTSFAKCCPHTWTRQDQTRLTHTLNIGVHIAGGQHHLNTKGTSNNQLRQFHKTDSENVTPKRNT